MDFRALFHPFDFFCYLLIMKKIWNCIILKNPIVINLSETPSNYDQEKKIPNIVQKFHIYGNVNKYSLLYIVLGLIFQYIIVEQIGAITHTPDPNHFLILELTN